jgi:hypothetical protein
MGRFCIFWTVKRPQGYSKFLMFRYSWIRLLWSDLIFQRSKKYLNNGMPTLRLQIPYQKWGTRKKLRCTGLSKDEKEISEPPRIAVAYYHDWWLSGKYMHLAEV